MAQDLTTVVTSATQKVEINRSNPTAIIGERINPTGRKKVLAALQAGNFDIVELRHVRENGHSNIRPNQNASIAK